MTRSSMQACPRIFRMALACLSRADSTSTACERRANNVRVMVRGYASTSCSRRCVAREGVHSRVCSPARRSDGSQPRNWVRRVSPNGESGDARNGTPALARAYMHISARGAIRAHTHADTCLRSRCAGIAPFIEFGIITVIIGVVAAVSAAAAPLLVGPTSPLRLVLVAADMYGFRDHG